MWYGIYFLQCVSYHEWLDANAPRLAPLRTLGMHAVNAMDLIDQFLQFINF